MRRQRVRGRPGSRRRSTPRHERRRSAAGSDHRIVCGVAIESIEAWILGIPTAIASVLDVDIAEVQKHYRLKDVEDLYQNSDKAERRPKGPPGSDRGGQASSGWHRPSGQGSCSAWRPGATGRNCLQGFKPFAEKATSGIWTAAVEQRRLFNPSHPEEASMGLLADWQIRKDVKIVPFAEESLRPGVVSFGVSSYGYDVRVGRHFKVFTNVYGAIIDPKQFGPRTPFVDIEGDFCIIPPNSFALAETVEYFEIPRDVLAVCLGKSTYARCGIIVNVTPLEPEWRGKITIEISNTTPLPAKIYANEGIAQILFFKARRGLREELRGQEGQVPGPEGPDAAVRRQRQGAGLGNAGATLRLRMPLRGPTRFRRPGLVAARLGHAVLPRPRISAAFPAFGSQLCSMSAPLRCLAANAGASPW